MWSPHSVDIESKLFARLSSVVTVPVLNPDACSSIYLPHTFPSQSSRVKAPHSETQLLR